MNDDLPRPPTPPLAAPEGAFEDVRRRARRRRGARLTALSLAAVLPLAVAGAVVAGALGERDPDSVRPVQASEECPGPYSPSESPPVAPEGPEPTGSAPGAGVMPPPRPTIPPGTPDATGTLQGADGSYIRCGGIYLVDQTQTLRLVARSDHYARWSAPCRYGRMVAFAFEPYEPYRKLTDGNHAWVEFENPANQKQPCAEPVDVRMGPPSTVTIRLTGVPSPGPGDPVRELRLTCGDLDAFSGRPLVVLRPDPEDGLYRAGGLAPCMYSIADEDGEVVELRVLEAGENARWEVRAR